jgi:hypothetical protein
MRIPLTNITLPIFLVYCSWCHKFLWRIKLGWPGGVTHGICKCCFLEMEQEV